MREVVAPTGHYVIRAEPAAVDGGWGSIAVTRYWIGRLRGDRSWRVNIRRWEDDPLGPAVYAETAASRQTAREAVARLDEELRAGRLVLG